MYGLTETSPIITINRQTKPDVALGSVGKIIDGVEVNIAEDGEILCKGHNVMLGYYKDPALTASVFDKDGWFHTGDIGYLDKKGFLFVTDRKKEIFKLSNGKFIAPQHIENKLKESVLIDQVMVVGEHEKFASALVSPNFSYLNEWCREQNINFQSKEELINLPPIQEQYNRAVKDINQTLNGPEKILRFRLVAEEWMPSTGELSPTLKLKRNFISTKYEDLIKSIYIKQMV